MAFKLCSCLPFSRITNLVWLGWFLLFMILMDVVDGGVDDCSFLFRLFNLEGGLDEVADVGGVCTGDGNFLFELLNF